MAADGKQLASLLCENQNNPQEKGNKFAKMRWSLLDCKPLFDLLIFSLKYERFSLASGVTRNSRSQDYKRYSRTKKRRDSNSLRAVPGIRWVTHYFLQIIFASWSPLVCPCYKVNHYKRKTIDSKIFVEHWLNWNGKILLSIWLYFLRIVLITVY